MQSVAVSYATSTTLTRAQITSGLSNRALRVLALFQLLKCEGPANESWVRQESLAEELGVSVSTIHRAFKELVEKGFLRLSENKFLGRFKSYVGKRVRAGKTDAVEAPEPLRVAPSSTSAPAGPGPDPDVVRFPKPLELAIATLREKIPDPSARSRAILDTIAQHLPASFFYDDDQPTLVPPKPVPPPLPKPTPSIAELRSEFQRIINAGGPTFATDALKISMQIQALTN